MSLHDFKLARLSRVAELPFATLIMAAAGRADSVNYARLEAAFPEIVAETRARWNSEGGRLPSDSGGA
jgi:hypothetical protein